VAVAEFSFTNWQFRYPELVQYVPEGMANAYFAEATLYLDNSDRSPVQDVTRRGLILGMIVAHIAKLNAPVNDGETQQLVGRISNAAEGSVSVATAMTVPGTAEWFAQTQPGIAAYQALASTRTFRYFTGGRRW
jgi:hypothetical protein